MLGVRAIISHADQVVFVRPAGVSGAQAVVVCDSCTAGSCPVYTQYA